MKYVVALAIFIGLSCSAFDARAEFQCAKAADLSVLDQPNPKLGRAIIENSRGLTRLIVERAINQVSKKVNGGGLSPQEISRLADSTYNAMVYPLSRGLFASAEARQVDWIEKELFAQKLRALAAVTPDPQTLRQLLKDMVHVVVESKPFRYASIALLWNKAPSRPVPADLLESVILDGEELHQTEITAYYGKSGQQAIDVFNRLRLLSLMLITPYLGIEQIHDVHQNMMMKQQVIEENNGAALVASVSQMNARLAAIDREMRKHPGKGQEPN